MVHVVASLSPYAQSFSVPWHSFFFFFFFLLDGERTAGAKSFSPVSFPLLRRSVVVARLGSDAGFD